jgi:hypothetical protein
MDGKIGKNFEDKKGANSAAIMSFSPLWNSVNSGFGLQSLLSDAKS